MHGQTKELKVLARVTYMKASEKTRAKMPGNLLGGRARFEVPLAAFDITGPKGMDIVGAKVGENIQIDVRFTGTTATASAGNPCAGKAGNPCNPCAGKASNPCNPCSGKS